MPNLEIESSYKNQIIAGVDEVGRGPLAGPVVAAAVIVKPEIYIDGINDSKKIPILKREELFKLITEHYTYGIGEASVAEINQYNILEATKLAMERAVTNLKVEPHIILVDGNMKFHDKRYISIIKGDSLSISIAAASIIAKVYRDNLMHKISKKYPEYQWDQNKGYGTKAHTEALKIYGATEEHRKKFISKLLSC